MKTLIKYSSSVIFGLLLMVSNASAVEIAKDFVITNRATGKPIRMTDYAGKILMLDFFAYWCGPCQSSSPVVETEIAEYYQTKRGNPAGIPVVVIGVNVESSSPSLTDQFIARAGLKTVADDFGNTGGAWAQFGRGGIPHFVVINGVKGGNHQQWEVLHSQSGFYGATYYRGLIDAVKKPIPTPAEIVVQQPLGTDLVDGISKRVFGNASVFSTSIAKTFTIKNTGGASLTGLTLTKIGTDPGNFIVSRLSKTTLAPGESTTFKVQFRPSAIGLRNAAVRIMSNDADENPFDIELAGRGTL